MYKTVKVRPTDVREVREIKLQILHLKALLTGFENR